MKSEHTVVVIAQVSTDLVVITDSTVEINTVKVVGCSRIDDRPI